MIIDFYENFIIKEFLRDKIYHFSFPGSAAHLNYEIISHFLKKNLNQDYLLRDNSNSTLSKYILNIKRKHENKYRKVIKFLQNNDSEIIFQSIGHKKNLFMIKKKGRDKNFQKRKFLINFDRMSLMSNFYCTHSCCETVDYFKKLNYKICCTIRDPLETIISFANKLSYNSPEKLLNNINFFEKVIKRINDYHYASDNVNFIKFEKPYNDYYFNNLKRLIKIDQKDIIFIKDNFLYKKISDNPYHFWKPEENKITKYINYFHLKVLKKNNMKFIIDKINGEDVKQIENNKPTMDYTEMCPNIDLYLNMMFSTRLNSRTKKSLIKKKTIFGNLYYLEN